MHKSEKTIKRRMFSLVELMVSMFIFLLLMGVMSRYFAAANQVWHATARKNEVYANAKIAMGLVVRDLQCSMYNNDWTTAKGVYPFWHTGTGTPVATLGQSLNFISASPLKPLPVGTTKAVSNVCEVRYSVVAKDSSITVGTETFGEFWLIRSSVGDNNTVGMYNFEANPMSGFLSTRMDTIFGAASSAAWQKVIPNVVDLTFQCYGMDSSNVAYEIPALTATSATGSIFPYYIKITMSLIDNSTYKKYRHLVAVSGQTKADEFLVANKLTFSRTVYMRRRESY